MDIQVKVTLPDDLTDLDSSQVSRDVFEQVVAESYRTGKISLKQVRLLLGFSSRFEAEDFIHSHKATGYTIEDLKQEMETMKDLWIGMIVIADTSPISYLILIDEIELLPQLYGEIVIPPAVFDELTAVNAPIKVRDWMEQSPEWLEKIELSRKVEPQHRNLDPGESEAIQLAIDLGADLLLIDDLVGRQVAHEIGLRIIGLIGVLAAAKVKGLINVESVITKLENTNFFIAGNLLEYLRNS